MGVFAFLCCSLFVCLLHETNNYEREREKKVLLQIYTKNE